MSAGHGATENDGAHQVMPESPHASPMTADACDSAGMRMYGELLRIDSLRVRSASSEGVRFHVRAAEPIVSLNGRVDGRRSYPDLGRQIRKVILG